MLLYSMCTCPTLCLLLGAMLCLCSVRGAEDALKKAKRRLKRKKEKAGLKKAKTGDKAMPGKHSMTLVSSLVYTVLNNHK